MDIKIVNSCKKMHKIDAENVVRHILERIPNKFLIGLKEVHVFDSKEEEPDIKYIPCSHTLKYSVIEINMDHPTLKGMPFFPILTLNVMFLFAINDHIKNYLKHCSEDEDILSYPTGRVNYNWMYLGIWNPVLVLFKIINYLISKISIFRKISRYFIDQNPKD